MTSLRQRVLDELQRRNYSNATTRGYILAIKQFADYFGKSPELLGGDEIREFETYLLRDKKLAPTRSRGAHVGLAFSLQQDTETAGRCLRCLIFRAAQVVVGSCIEMGTGSEHDRFRLDATRQNR